MKSTIITCVLSASLLMLTAANSSAQMAGGGPAATPAPAKNTQSKGFFIKFGMALPVSDFKQLPAFGTLTPNDWSQMPVSNGTMGAKTGFYAETGFGLDLMGSTKEKFISFYYFPIVAAYWQTALDWSGAGGLFTEEAIYTKPFRMIDIGQRYGVRIRPPVENLSVGIYYRPGLVIPLGFEVVSGSEFLLSGEMSVAEGSPVLMMSHAGGLSISYSIVALSLEYYYSQPTMDVTYSYPSAGVIQTTMTGKIPVRLLNISLSVGF